MPLNVSCGFLKHRQLLTRMVRGNNNEIIIVLFMIALVELSVLRDAQDVNVCMYAQFSRHYTWLHDAL